MPPQTTRPEGSLTCDGFDLNLEEALSILNQSAEQVSEDIQDNDLLEDRSVNDINDDELIRE